MIPMVVNDRKFLVDFRHRRRTGKSPTIYGGSPLNGVTTCAVIGLREPPFKPDAASATELFFVALGSAICVRSDQFNRRAGRRLAFHDAVTRCGILRDVADALLAEYDRIWPPPMPGPPAQRQPKTKLTDEQKDELRALAAAGPPDAAERRQQILATMQRAPEDPLSRPIIVVDLTYGE